VIKKGITSVKYQRFEDVPVWQDGINLTVKVFTATSHPSFRFKGDIANQLQRAALSVPNNIAEGFERGTTSELISFLYYSRGSVGEVRSICHVILRMPEFADQKSQITEIKDLAESISRQLAGWLKSLKETDMPGQRHFTEKDKILREQRKRADTLIEKLKRETQERLAKNRWGKE
jgi:four helix bundle protein